MHATSPFDRGVSWGCGLGAFERGAIRTRVARHIDAFDASAASLEDARREAQADGIPGIDYRLGDFNDPRFAPGGKKYDIAFFHASLHHGRALERLFRRIALRGLKHRGVVYVDEYVGPSRFHWSKGQLSNAQAVLDQVPPWAKVRTEVPPPVEVNDPSEAVRSDEIPGFLRDFFDIIAWRPFGGQIAGLVFTSLVPEWVHSDPGQRLVATMLKMEDEELQRDPSSTHHLVAYGRLKPLWRLVRPLGPQVAAAIRRRLPIRRTGAPSV